jgi:hypothetical protein
MTEPFKFTITMDDFIDVALVIMAKTDDRDIIDFYLDLLPRKLSNIDFDWFLTDKQFFVTGYEDLSNDIQELKDILKENEQWEEIEVV